MSDRKNLSDYKKPRTDLNRLLPDNNLLDAKILEGLNENLFNRFFTKDEVERIVGIIGSDEFTTEDVNQILEPTPFRQANQLQPIVYNKVGNIDWFMSFQDFMNRLRLLGVNIDRFNEWGNSLQFNWVPPIDIDKLINYQDYFWDSAGFDDPPQYITIKDQCQWVTGRQTQTLKGVATVLPTYEIVGYDDVGVNQVWVDGNQTTTLRVGEPLVLSGSSQTPVIATIDSTFFNVGSNRTEIEVSGFTVTIGTTDVYSFATETEIAVISTNEANKEIVVAGDITNLFEVGYVFSAELSASAQAMRLFSVASSVYDVITDQTTVTTNEELTNTFDWTIITVKPLIRSINAETDVICDSPFSRTQFGVFNESLIGEIIWTRFIQIISSTTGVAEGTNLGSSLFTDTSGLKDFLSGDVVTGDIVRITGTGFDGDYPIDNIVTSDIVDLGRTFFTETSIDYEVVRPRSLADISFATAPAGVVNNQLWFDTTNNQLRQWDGALWNVVVDNFNLLVDINNNAHLVDLSQDNDWVDQNNWIHRTEINNFTGKSRAQQPIIEFFPYIKLSAHSFADKQWRYRRDDTISYAATTSEPSLLEIIDTRVVVGGEVAFQNDTTLVFDEKFGNLTTDLVEGTLIQLGDFSVNTGQHTVVSSEFVQLAPGTRYRTRVTLLDPVNDPLDVPVGAYVAPVTTTLGDPWLSFETFHWQFEGIEDISASSIEPVINPMLSEVVSSSVSSPLQTIVGLVFQEFKREVGSGSIFGAAYDLDSSLHDLALYEDFQEGDVRVYINGQRQFGNFVDQQSVIDPDFVGGILFNPDIEITETDIVRIELGEYALADVGKRNVLVNTVSGTEQFNLVDLRRLEQVKSERSQYPFFNVFDVNKNPLRFATEIFRYQDEPTGTYFADIDQRIFFDPVSQDYRFEQRLLDATTGELYLYCDGREFEDEFQSIWKRGLNNEQFVPVEADGFWSIPNQLYYNVKHENRDTIKLTEVFRHFNTIILEQSAPGIVSNSFTNVHHLDNNVNYGLGGRIKEHNDGFDTLLSAMFVNNVNPLDLISFANDRYDNNEILLKEFFQDNIVTYFNTAAIDDVSALSTFVQEAVKDEFEKNDRLDQWFGDSTTFCEDTNEGVKNHIATIPYMGLIPKVQPYLLSDNDFLQLVAHDGHRSNIRFNPATLESMFRILLQGVDSATQVVATDAEAFPALINGSPPTQGNLLVRTVTSEAVRKLYRFSNINVWELVDLSLMFAEILLNIEESLFQKLGDETLPDNFVPRFDFNAVISDAEYTTKVQEQFSLFVRERGIQTPFINSEFVQNDPFTWNYAYTTVNTDPVTGGNRSDVRASWEALYNLVYGTPFPHLEPWALQGYTSKPSFWDATYADATLTRRWISAMWTNILNGVIPVGNTAPDGTVGTGLAGQITTLFSYIPVNIDSVATTDGFASDAVLPPFWNSDNSPNPAVRSLHDASLQEFVTTPSAGYEFGQQGPDEWDWSISSQRLYDELVVSFKIQPLKFLNQSFGPELIDVACLQVDDRVNKVASHENIQFHGDIAADNSVIQVDGFNQWYVHFNRYNGFDGISSEFRQMWKDWEAPLTYQFGSFIDTQNFKISSDIFDVTTSDYEIIFKKSQGINDIWLDGLETTLLSVPSRFADDTDAGLDWTVSFNNTSPVGRPITSFGVQNYPVRVSPGDATYRTFSFAISGAEVQESVGFDVVQYSETVAPTIATELNNDTTLYFADVLFNAVDVVSLSIQGDQAQTFGDLVEQINLQLGSNGNAFLENGNLVIESALSGGSTSAVITDSGLFATASSFFLGTTGNNIALIEFEKVFFAEDNVSSFFPIGSTFDVLNSTNFNGTFTVVSATYFPEQGSTRIEVQEELTIPNTTIDGFMEPTDAVTLPDEWETGVGLHWGGNGNVPTPFNTTTIFYIIRVNDREFQLSLTQEGAVAGTPVIPQDEGTNQQYIGRVKNTFTSFQARNVLSYWKQHFVDTRVTKSFPTPTTISGVQNMIDFINGYDGNLQSLGFLFTDTDGTNRDAETGRANDWQLETEKFIEFLYTSRNQTEELREQYDVTPDAAGNSFTSTNVITWNTGTRVTLDVIGTGSLPTELSGPIASSIPYFIIQGAVQGRLQLAASAQEAAAGIAVPFSDNGSGQIVLRISPNVQNFPTHEINPQQVSVFIDHDTGIVSDVFAGSNLDLLTDQRVYDTNGRNLTLEDLIISRKDLRTQIELSGQRREANEAGLVENRRIGGMHIFFDGFEHVIQYENYSSDGNLIYDAFLGINTPRFFLELDRQTEFTLRPNVGGTVVLDQEQVQNVESAIESLRFAYSTSRSKEGDEITQKVREALGYDGPFDFADDIGITDKSQFIFYRGLIQKKGTNFAADAFTNQLTYDNIEVDEFWAYRLACFGDSKERSYPELKLFSSDVIRKELRLEFLAPLATVSDASFDGIELASEERWFEQPDQVEVLSPRDRFYINVRCVQRFENVVRSPSFFTIGAEEYVQLDEPADAAFVNYIVPLSAPPQFLQLTEGVNYEFITTTLIRFFGAILPSSFDINVATLSYNYDAQNPARLINRRDGLVVTEVPIWNPAREQYFSKAIYAVDFRKGDVASFTMAAAQTEAAFNGVGDNGTFLGGTGFTVGEIITLSNGATVQVDTEALGVVTGFTLLTQGGRTASGQPLTQATVDTGVGVGFALTTGVDNLEERLRSDDPARYNSPIDAGDAAEPNYWDKRFQDKVWFYTGPEGYLPFDDRNVETNANERFKNWGKLSDWGQIKVYQWTASDVLPAEYDSLATQDEIEANLPINSRKTGFTRKVVFRNDGTATDPVWVTEEDQHYDFVSNIVTSTTYPTVLVGEEVEVYVDGIFNSTQTFSSAAAFETFVSSLFGTLIHVINRATVPTQQQIADVSYKIDTPFSVVNRIDPVSGQELFTYYFWVEDRLSSIPILGGPEGNITLRTVREGLQNIPTPFMIPNNVVDITATSFADLFSTNSPHREDTVSYEFPFTYNQLVVKGLAGTVQSDDAYTLRFTRDFTLRDRLARPDRVYQLIAGQTETDYDGLTQNGTFTAGSGYSLGQIIVLSNGTDTVGQPTVGAIVQVLAEVAGAITSFTVVSPGNNFDMIGQTLTQINAGGGGDFTLTPGLFNVTEKLLSEIPELLKKNVHTEWKLFREKQFAKVDRDLWNAITESILGFEYDGEPLSGGTVVTPTPSPSVSPSPTPTPAAVTPTITPTTTPDVTPTLTPNVTPTPTLTPSVTGSPVPLPSSTPAVTPTQTPVASPTPSPAGEVGLFTTAGTPTAANVTAFSIGFIDAFPFSATATITFKDDAEAVDPNSAKGFQIGSDLIWLYPPALGDSSLYEIRMDPTAGSFTGGDSTGVWLDLTDTRSWELLRTTFGTTVVSGTFSIRDKATMTTQITRGFSATAQVDVIGDIGGEGFF